MDEGPELERLVRAERAEFELHLAMEERAERRIRLIMIVGSLFSFLQYPMAAYLMDLAWRHIGEAAAFAAVSLLPLTLGSLIAFLGMTLTDHRRNVGEWGFARPSRCLVLGSAPLVLSLIVPPVFIILCAMVLAAWLLMILGARVTAEIIERSTAVKF